MEIHSVSLSDIGEQAYLRQNHVVQSLHFVGLGYSGFEYSSFIRVVQLPQRYGNSDLGIVAAGRETNLAVSGDELTHPLLDYGLSVGTRYRSDGSVEAFAGVCSCCLQGLQRIFDQKIGNSFMQNLGQAAANENPHALFAKRFYEAVSVVIGGAKSEKRRSFCRIEPSGIEQKKFYFKG